MGPQGRSGFGVFMRREVIANHDRAGLDFWNQDLADIGGERFAVHGPLDDPGSNKLIMGKTCDKCLSAPCAKGRGGCQPGAALGSPAQSGHVGFDTGFVDEDDAVRFCSNGWKPPAKPVSSSCLYVRLVAFIRDEALFLYVYPIRRSTISMPDCEA